MRDKPAFHELEPPAVVTTPIDGLTDEEWVERNERRGRVIRRISGIVFGIAFGLFAGFVAISRLDPSAPYYDVAVCLVMGGCLLAFVTIFTSSREPELADVLGWVMAPEWMLLRRLPWWACALLALMAGGLFLVMLGTIVLGHLPWFAPHAT